MRTNPGVNSGQPFYYAQDHEGSVTHLLDSSGNNIETYKYDAFGAPTFYNGSGTQIASTAYNNRFLFTGREYAATYRNTYIPAFTFYEYRTRAYNPALGRFMSEDPKGFVRRAGLGKASGDWSFTAHPDEGEFNLFRYCGNDPVDFTDPTGLDAQAWAEAFIPGAYEYDQAALNLRAGNYGTAAGWAATGIASQVVGVYTAGGSTRAQAGLRAARIAASERNVAAVIGKYLDNPSYIEVGKHLNVKVLDIPTHLWEQMSPSQRWTTTQKFLDGIIAREGDFLFNKPIKSIGSQSGEFRKELDYISQKGFQLSQDGWGMTKVVEDASTASKHFPVPLKP
jgi:RHS repeat-associated protein